MSLAVQFSEYGSIEVLRVVDAPPLTAGPGQVRLAVRAAGVRWVLCSRGAKTSANPAPTTVCSSRPVKIRDAAPDYEGRLVARAGRVVETIRALRPGRC